MTGDAKQAYRPALLNAKYMKQAYLMDNPGQLVQITGIGAVEGETEAEACPHD